ncbi:MAG: hypothetical protein EOO91_18660 [Pedobacter sp.]|nr:MAG: hypothetical protein EOO91_18660 [Pedobacter sp.]
MLKGDNMDFLKIILQDYLSFEHQVGVDLLVEKFFGGLVITPTTSENPKIMVSNSASLTLEIILLKPLTDSKCKFDKQNSLGTKTD